MCREGHATRLLPAVSAPPFLPRAPGEPGSRSRTSPGRKRMEQHEQAHRKAPAATAIAEAAGFARQCHGLLPQGRSVHAVARRRQAAVACAEAPACGTGPGTGGPTGAARSDQDNRVDEDGLGRTRRMRYPGCATERRERGQWRNRELPVTGPARAAPAKAGFSIMLSGRRVCHTRMPGQPPGNRLRTWRNGIRSRLKICFPPGSAGSSPAVRTNNFKALRLFPALRPPRGMARAGSG